MQVKLLCPLWGHEHLKLAVFLYKVRIAGYDGIETWLPESKSDRRSLYRYVDQHGLYFIAHQYEAKGTNFSEFRNSFAKNLSLAAEGSPLSINSHTGLDHFTTDQFLALIDTASEFSYKTSIPVLHETHRGRLGYCPQMISEIFDLRPDFRITADFSHWVCVTESMLENFQNTLQEAIKRARHVHARVGFPEGPQIPDPRAPEWANTVDVFLSWWDQIVAENIKAGTEVLSFTTEFGPEPYMPKIPFSETPMVDQFAINCYMKDLLKNRFSAFTQV